MALHEWRVSLLDGKSSVRISRDGIQHRGKAYPWKDLTEASFARYTTRGGRHEELKLWFGADTRLKLRWLGTGRRRAAWREMLVDFAHEAGLRRPDLSLRDGPDEEDARPARWIGLGIVGIALTIMAAIFVAGPGLAGVAAALWIGVVGSIVGLSIYGHYTRTEPPPHIDWASFKAREGQPGDLPGH